MDRTSRHRDDRRPAPPRWLRAWLASLLLATPAGAQVTPISPITTIATATPALSPVGPWQTAAAGGGVSAAANSLTIRINSGAIQTLASLVDGTVNSFPSPVSITTQWDVSTLIGNVDLVGYFASPTSALTSGTNTLPSSRMLGRMTTGRASSFTPFTGAAVNGVGTAGASLLLFRQLIISPFNGIGQRTDNLDLQLDLSGITNLPAGTYSGTLTLRAISY